VYVVAVARLHFVRLVANLGSLAVRLLFTPVEEAAFTAFSRCGNLAVLLVLK
jgi:hypothetical protein